jgi:hypothetical protein
MPLRAFIATLALAVSGIPANAGTVAYGEAFDTLYVVDLTTRNASPIGVAGSWGGATIANVEGLTFSPNGKLYAVSDTLFKALMTIDPATGQASVIGPLGGGAGLGDSGQGTFDVLDLGLTFTCDGRLWLSSGYTGSFWQVDPATGATTRIGKLGATITGLTARGNQVFGAGSQDSPNLYSIDLASGQATAVGPYGQGLNPITTASPGFDTSGKLWSVLDNVPPLPPTQTPQWSTLATISPKGALATVGDITTPTGIKYPSNVTQLPYVGLKGLAIASPCAVARTAVLDPAPATSPTGLAILMLLIASVAGTSLRRRRQMKAVPNETA